MTNQTTAPQPTGRRRVSPITVTVVLVVALILVFLGVAGVITELLWHDQLGYLSVFLTQWIAAGAMFLVGFFAMAIPIFFAIDIAYRKRPVYARLTAQLDRYQELVEPLRKFIKWALPITFGIFGGFAAAVTWQQTLLWLNAEPTGIRDPEFNLDVSFFMFDLPFWQGVLGFASAVVLISLILGVATSYLYGGISFVGRDVRVSKATRIQAAVLAFVYLALQGVSLWFDRFSVLTDYSGLYTGATFTGANAVIPGKQILAGIAVIVAILFLVTAFTGRWRLPVIGTALLLVSALVVGAGYPWVIQEFRVNPDEKSLENEYLERNIEATRFAYGIDDVEVERYDAVTDAEPGQLRGDAQTTANIRIIDPEVVSPTFAQLEQSRQYYKFPASLSVDRYELDGQIEDTVSALREIDVSGQSGWYNRTLVYTHGYGLVAAYGNQRSAGGEPVFLESGIPTSGRLGEFQPRIYFGQYSPEYSIVGGERARPIELDYPADDDVQRPAEMPVVDDGDTTADPTDAGDAVSQQEASGDLDGGAAAEENVADVESAEDAEAVEEGRQNMTTFDGDGGPVLENIFTKLIYALKFQSMEILLSDAVVDGSQILYDRDPVTRVSKVAPYLTIDSSPYASVVDGEIVWIIDGYTTSEYYPYSEMRDFNSLIVDADSPRTSVLAKPVNYIRNSVKATVNAYDGSVTLYAWDTEDPVLKAWSNIFSDTVQPISEMSGDLLSHVRYPSDLFKVQREMLSTYHVTNADVFYSAEDAWRTPNDPVSSAQTPDGEKLRQPPYYLTLAAGRDAEPTFSIYSTYIPAATGGNARDILTGYLAANSNAGNVDGEKSDDYGSLKLLTLPKGTTVPGPGQVQNSFTTDSEVSNLLNVLQLGNSQVISGNLLTLPVGGVLLYVQPVYIRASSGTSFPILQKVLVSFGDDIAFEDTLDAALDVLFGGNSGASAGDGELPDEGESSEAGDESAEGGEGPSPGASSSTLTQALRDMQQAIADRDEAMKSGDWAAYGQADERLREALAKALELQ